MIGHVNNVNYKYGTTVLQTKGNWGAVTLGNYIIGDQNIEPNENNYLFQHEYGHHLQSKASGWMYLSKYGIPSLIDAAGNSNHNFHAAEQDANVRAFRYFSKNIDNFNWTDENGIQQSRWERLRNPIRGYDWSLNINDNVNINALNAASLSLAWYDWVMAPLNLTIIGIPIPGLVNALILKQ